MVNPRTFLGCLGFRKISKLLLVVYFALCHHFSHKLCILTSCSKVFLLAKNCGV